MVLEHLFPDNWLEKKLRYSLFLGFFYSLIGIFTANLLFSGNSGLASVMFTSILLIPSLRKLFSIEEHKEEKEKSFSLKQLYLENKNLIHAYLGIFIGAYLAYYLVSFLSMYFGWGVFNIFSEQVFLDPAISGRATFNTGLFSNILENNWWVLLACFALSFISGNGAIFFIIWNASAWAVIFAIRAVGASVVLNESFLLVAAKMTLITAPHILLEGGAYILAGMAGAVISKDILLEHKNLKIFLLYSTGIISLFFLLNTILNRFQPGFFMIFLKILIFVGLSYFLKNSFPDKKHKEVFIYNYWLFIFAILIFILGVLIETIVLSNSTLLIKYYAAFSTFII